MSNEIQVPVDGKRGHIDFASFMNDLYSAYVSNPIWDELMSYVTTNLGLQDSKFLCFEFYEQSGKNYFGTLIVSNHGTSELKGYYFDSQGNLAAYVDEEIDKVLEIDNSLNIRNVKFGDDRIFVAKATNTGSNLFEFTMEIVEFYGCTFPMLVLRLVGGSGAVAAKCLVDTNYDNRVSSSYFAFIQPDAGAATYLVKNISGAKITLEVPVVEGHVKAVELSKGESTTVPKTEWTLQYLTSLKQNKLIIFT